MTDPVIAKYLRQHYICSSRYYTHTSSIEPLGSFNLERNEIEEFWSIYCNALQNNENFVAGITETSKDYIPVLADVDLKVSVDKIKDPEILSLDKHLFNKESIYRIISIYQSVLKKVIKDYQPKNGICLLLEKPNPRLDKNKNEICSGFHLHFINAILHKYEQDIHIIPKVKEFIRDDNTFEFVRDYGKNKEDLIDISSTRNTWLLYGGKKHDYLQYSYKLTKIYNDVGKEISVNELLDTYKLYDISEDEIKLDEKTFYYNLPRILSLHTIKQPISYVKQSLRCNRFIKEKFKKADDISDSVGESNKNVKQVLDKASDYLAMVSDSRADDYLSWMQMGWILYNIGEGTMEALELWIDFSKRTTRENNFSEAVCAKQWENMEKRNLTIKTLRYYASIDSPEEYEEYCKKEITYRIKKSLEGGHYDLAIALKERYGIEFICTVQKKGKDQWFTFDNHRWVKTEKGIELRKKISTFLVDKFKAFRKDLYLSLIENIEDDVKKTVDNKVDKINKLIGNLKSTSFKNNIMTECHEVFYDKDFFKKLDTNPNLLGFKNGVYDLENDVFRPGKPDDYITLTTDYDYTDYTNNKDHQDIKYVLDFLEKVFPDTELRQYFLEFAASLLRGENYNKVSPIFRGEGDNAKSATISLIKAALGEYYYPLPTSLVTGKRTQSSSATPELLELRGKRATGLQEPNKGDVLNVGIWKELTGNDIFYVRGLYEDPMELIPLYKIILICNDLPNLPGDDPALWNRLRVLNFESWFPKDKSKVPSTREEQFKRKIFTRDDFLKDKFPYMKKAFMWLLIQEYRRIQIHGNMEEPFKVREATLNYRKSNDIFSQFIDDKISVDDSKELTVVDAYHCFKDWYKSSFFSSKITMPNKLDLQEYFIKLYGKLNGKKWIGISIKEDNDNVIYIEEKEKEKKIINDGQKCIAI